MELRTLHYFTVVAQELNITRAAEKLNMSQPPLSNQIKALEEELGVQLFIRGKRHLELTEEGGLLLRRAVQIQELADKTRQEIASLREGMTGVIYLSMVEGRAPFLAARGSLAFGRSYPWCGTTCGMAAATMCWTGFTRGWLTWLSSPPLTTPNTWRAFPWVGNPGLLCFTQTIPWPRRWETPFPYPAWQGSR